MLGLIDGDYHDDHNGHYRILQPHATDDQHYTAQFTEWQPDMQKRWIIDHAVDGKILASSSTEPGIICVKAMGLLQLWGQHLACLDRAA